MGSTGLVDIEDLRSFIDMVTFPVGAAELAARAKAAQAPLPVVSFLESINPGQVLPDQTEVLTRAEAANVLRQNLAEVPASDSDEMEID